MSLWAQIDKKIREIVYLEGMDTAEDVVKESITTEIQNRISMLTEQSKTANKEETQRALSFVALYLQEMLVSWEKP